MNDSQTAWYLVLTKPRQENIAQSNLLHQGFQVYLPFLQHFKRKQRLYQVVSEPLFPRYLFISLRSGIDDWSKVRSTKGCISLVRFGSLPARIPNQLIEHLKTEENLREHMTAKSPDFKPGDRVRILEGILENYEGIIEMKNGQQRVTLLLTIANDHMKRISIPLNQLERI